MNLRWLIGNYADPQYSLSREEQKRVNHLAHNQYLSDRKLGTWTAIMVVGCMVAVGVLPQFIKPVLTHLQIPAPGVFAIAIATTLGVLVSIWGYRSLYIRPVRLAMRDLGYDICLGCGYRLDGLDATIDRCPECGQMRLTGDGSDEAS